MFGSRNVHGWNSVDLIYGSVNTDYSDPRQLFWTPCIEQDLSSGHKLDIFFIFHQLSYKIFHDSREWVREYLVVKLVFLGGNFHVLIKFKSLFKKH